MPTPAVVAPESERVVAVNVKRLREARGISQVHLAKLMTEAGYAMGGMPVWALENGRRRINIADLFGFAEIFGVTPESLLTTDAVETAPKSLYERVEEGAQAGRGDVETAPKSLYEVTVTGGTVRNVAADGFDFEDGFLNFYLQGERVFFAPSAAVLCVAILQEVGDDAR